MVAKREWVEEKSRLERLVAEANQRVTLLERERQDLREENERLKERARLIDRVREDLSTVNEKLELLTRLTKEINSLNPEKIFETAVTKIPYILGARFASIYIYDEEAKKLYLRKHTHGRAIDRVVELQGEMRSLMARVVAAAKVRVFSDLETGAEPPTGAEQPPSDPLSRPHRELYRTRSCIVAPLRAGGKILGVLNLADRVDGRAFSEDQDLPLVQQIAELLAISLRNWKLFEKVQRQAKTDSLTRLANHQAFFDDLAREITRAERYGTACTVVMVDLDRFKQVNDSHGHLAGDFVLEEVARALKGCVRNVDTAARYGGDEFALLLPESDLRGALAVAERVQKRVEQQRFTFGGKDLPVCLSFGLAQHRPGETATELVKAADECLYRAKRDGGGRMTVRE